MFYYLMILSYFLYFANCLQASKPLFGYVQFPPSIGICTATLSNKNIEIGQISLENEIVSIEFDRELSDDSDYFKLTVNNDKDCHLIPSSSSSFTFRLPTDESIDLFFIEAFTSMHPTSLLETQLLPQSLSSFRDHTMKFDFDSTPSLIDETAFAAVILLYLCFSISKKPHTLLFKHKRSSKRTIIPSPSQKQIHDSPPVIRTLDVDNIDIVDSSTDVKISNKDETNTEKDFTALASLALSVPVLPPSSPIKIKVDKTDGCFFLENPLFSHRPTQEPAHLKWHKLHGPSSSTLRSSCTTNINLLRRRAVAMRMKLRL
jgi:hypothetical protein